MDEELIPYHGRDLVAVRVVEKERLVPPIEVGTYRRPEVAAQVECVENEPLAPAFCRIETIEGQPSRSGLRRGRATEERRKQAPD